MLDFAGDHRRNERLIEPWDFPLRELMELTMWKRDIRRERMDDPDTERSKIEVCACFRLASAFRMPSFGTLNILRTALLMRSASVFPGTCGASWGFI
jgi:hypothetical protein